ncbi:S1 RNA-binding domain-containing protein [Nocardia sp. NPDC058633]|uniref:S1 RNA-binding domain-containing protein n=1 Tax=Nocardia sp. NPDC058633 TaxID=3346568 RepID=UPI00365F86BA
MTDHDPTELNLEIARKIYPVGQHVTGVVVQIPRPGAGGLFVDLGTPPWGFVDVSHLPDSPERWPTIGTVTDFEVVHHTHQGHQVRLIPLDPTYRARPRSPIDAHRLRALKRHLSGDQA